MVFSGLSTVCRLNPTGGRIQHGRMVYPSDFSARLDHALAMNGLDNATFASALGEKGQQLVNRWRKRGKIGQPSVPKVRNILARTGMTWLQEGVGTPERSNESEATPGHRPSYAARLDPVILAQALTVVEYDEAQGGLYPYPKLAELLIKLYDRIANGEHQLALMAELAYERKDQGAQQHDRPTKQAAGGARPR